MRFALCTGGKGSGQEADGSWQRAESKGQGAECGALRAKSKVLSVEYQESEGYALCAMRCAISAMRLAPAAIGQPGDSSRSQFVKRSDLS